MYLVLADYKSLSECDCISVAKLHMYNRKNILHKTDVRIQTENIF